MTTNKKFTITAERDYRRARIEITISDATPEEISMAIRTVQDFSPYWHPEEGEKKQGQESVNKRDTSGDQTLSYYSEEEGAKS